ncbi:MULTISPECIES: GNAT family N-acetyltransferase [Larsenimonas]|uniref:N-acetyltransferase n=1 Tax=Larsenimonas suaedae TaxID=1851019 RepID=A0ABU1GUE5_9GAMM|nr:MULTISPECIES: hypothetical protein [Larsenimonas]MCM2970949.1 hypothetical protein [Larsenimonas suaedae]MCM5703055.1 hypothetical protein [Larsenimonas salina]MDR5895658.1 hypothetical protein [Larsenimonas suaedae]
MAQLCADVYGMEAGLKPLVVFTGTLAAFIDNEVARVVALLDGDQKILSMALLALDSEGDGLELQMLATPERLRGKGYARELVERLTATTSLRVETRDPRLEQFLFGLGFNKWFYADTGARVGFNALAKVTALGDAPAPSRFDEDAIIRSFKHKSDLFETYKQRFTDALARAPELMPASA